MRRGARALAALLLATVLQAPAAGASLAGTVSHVTDGDSLWVRPGAGGAPLEVRLLDVDAPEGCQPFGAESARALRQRVLHERVSVRARGVDDYGRHLARVEHRRQDLGAWLVRQGYAWSMGYRGRPGPYAPLQAQARRERRGLWAAPDPLEPRRFRQRFGRCR